MKKLGLLVLVLLNLTCINNANATHLMGSDLTWRCVGQDSFLIKLVVYRDCNGISLGVTPINFVCATTSAALTSLSLAVGTPVDITPICNSSCTRCSNPGCSFPYGIEKYTIQGLVTLSGAGSCCKIRISWAQASRNATITTSTGAGTADLYVEATLNRCLNPCDNSPSFTNPPIAILCVGQDFTFNHGALDIDVNSTGGLADSLTYEWAEPLSAANTPIPYISPYLYNKAINFWGFPNDTLAFPKGLHLNLHSGDIQFQPMKPEVTIMVVKINEFRNGVKIGEIRRDLEIIVITCLNNNPPSITTPNNVRSKDVCAGDQVTFNFSTGDPNALDTVTIIYNNGIPGASWTHNNGLAKHPTGTLTWTPTNAQVSSLPYMFTVTARDDACPNRSQLTQAYQIRVMPLPRANITVTDSGCGIRWFKATKIEGTNPVYTWIGESFTFTTKTGPVTTHRFNPGLYPYTMTMQASGCSNTYFDTVEVEPFITNDLPPDMNVCYGSTITLNSTVKYNKGAITMVWGSKGTIFASSTGLSKTFIVTKDTVIWSRASDTIGCEYADTIHINMHNKLPIPVISLTPSDSFLECNLLNGSYEWFSKPDAFTSPIKINNNSRRINPKTYCLKCFFSVIYTDTIGCESDTSAYYNYGVNSVDRSTRSSRFIFYPNPAHNELFVENPDNESTFMMVTDIYGKIYFENKIKPGKSTINIQNYKPGIYFIFKDGMIAGKLLIE